MERLKRLQELDEQKEESDSEPEIKTIVRQPSESRRISRPSIPRERDIDEMVAKPTSDPDVISEMGKGKPSTEEEEDAPMISGFRTGEEGGEEDIEEEEEYDYNVELTEEELLVDPRDEETINRQLEELVSWITHKSDKWPDFFKYSMKEHKVN